MRIVAAPDKFRGTATAPEVVAAISAGAGRSGATVLPCPLADGGEGTIDAFGGANRFTLVTGPLGIPVNAGWRLDDDRAVIEMAAASGLLVAGGPAHNNPVTASTYGTGELIVAAAAAGARRVLVGVGGSATTDGGRGAVDALAAAGLAPLGRLQVTVCADVRTRFLDAARIFGPQKGAGPEQIQRLTDRLATVAADYRQRYGVDVLGLDRSGAAGGLAGGLAAIGADLTDGFTTLAEQAGLAGLLAGADLVVTGEGRLDAGSFNGKVVGGVVAAAARVGVPVLIVVGEATGDVPVPPAVTVVSLVARFGRDRAMSETVACVTDVVAEQLARR